MTAPGDFTSGAVLTAADMNDLPAGVLDVYNSTTAITFGTGFPGTAHMDVTATLDASRRYRVTVGSTTIDQNTLVTNVYLDLYIGSVVWASRVAVSGFHVPITSGNATLFADYIVDGGLSGSYTFYASFRTSAGTARAFATTINNTVSLQMSIEDIGTA